jgi:GrpB-like predicted nucleotidyltransferase (UPF0157 family)
MKPGITIVDYDPRWPDLYETEAQRIRDALGDLLVAVEHIGSTSVPGLAAKPRIDIMPAVASEAELNQTIDPMTALGFEYISRFEDEMPFRRLFSRNGTESEIAVNIHTVPVNSEFWERHLLFRDYLRSHPDIAAEYAELKRDLAPRFTETNDYAGAKTAFIQAIEARARAERDA